MNCGFAMRIGLKSHVKAVQGEDDNTLPQLPQSYHSASAVESRKLYSIQTHNVVGVHLQLLFYAGSHFLNIHSPSFCLLLPINGNIISEVAQIQNSPCEDHLCGRVCQDPKIRKDLLCSYILVALNISKGRILVGIDIVVRMSYFESRL
ncbi:uncharacterized protein [Lolium perenne]|uniref:uncharacterized protein n=1 Tax=Lolium perenne TaxID=4522 RepID=UPI0021F61439|nr:uncharacterized protein LOC127299841 [Lolium perenne]